MGTLALPLAQVLFLAGNLKWLQQLGRCECSADTRRDIIKYFCLTGMFASILQAWAAFNPAYTHDVNKFIVFPMLIVSLVYIPVAFSYLNDKRKTCKCFKYEPLLFWILLVQLGYTCWQIYSHKLI